MEKANQESERIRELLKSNPRGMSVTDIARNLEISRNTTAKYLEILRISGHVEMESIGTAKIYHLSQKIPVSTLLNFSSECILVVDSHLKVIQVNRKFLDLLNLEKSDVVGQTADRLLFPVLRNVEITVHLYEAIGGKEYKETIHIPYDGKDLYFYAKITPSTCDNGEQGATLILENVTEHLSSHISVMEHRNKLEMLVLERTKELEELNRSLKKEIAERIKEEKIRNEEKERYKQLFMESPLAYHIMNKEGILLEVNPAWLRVTGYAAEEVTGQPFENFLSDRDKEMLAKEVLGKEHNDTFHSYCDIVMKDGTTIKATLSCNSSPDKADSGYCIRCILKDATLKYDGQRT